MIARFAEQGITPAGGTPEQFRAYVASEIRRWREAAAVAKIDAGQ
jgi:tripartite-type tricarboxylate transporter receptor subunit TctC